MIKAFIKDPTTYPTFTFEEFIQWLRNQAEYQLDIETNMTDFWCDKKMRTIQFGSIDRSLQYILEWPILTDEQKALIKVELERYDTVKLIHYATFEYVVLRFHNIEVHNVYDTMLGEKVLTGGIDNADYDLNTLTWEYMQKTLDKSYQKRFGEEILTDGHVKYAADDVIPLAIIREKQSVKIEQYELQRTLQLENEVVLAFADMTYYGMGLNQKDWLANVDRAKPIVEAAEVELCRSILADEKLRKRAYELKYVSDKDRPIFNMRSPKQKAMILKWLYPEVNGSSKPILKKHMADYGQDLDAEKLAVLVDLVAGDNESLGDYVVKHHREQLIENELLIPAGTFSINWNSNDQVLVLFKAVAPRLNNMKKETKARQTHPIFMKYNEYTDTAKLLTTYGEAFLKHVEPDGKVRTSFNQIVSTGRSSSSSPNMQNIPAKESVGNLYRNCFNWDAGFTFVDSDFTGQELCLIAHIAKDEVWFEAIKRGDDLHSVTAEMVFKGKWKKAAESDCAYYKGKKKCKCPGHKRLRNAIKTINFGLAYGMSDMKLSSTLSISRQEAKNLIAEYFRAFPKIKRVLTFLGQFGVKNGYIKTIAPFYRRRWYPHWSFARKNVQAHLQDIVYDATLGSIERASKNQPIQGSGADIMKQAMVHTYKWIRANNYVDKINMVMNVHDQLTTVCEDDLTEMWVKQLDALMVEAGEVVVTSKILKAETESSPVWTK